MKIGYKVHEVDEMDMAWFFELAERQENQGSSKQKEVYIDQIIW